MVPEWKPLFDCSAYVSDHGNIQELICLQGIRVPAAVRQYLYILCIRTSVTGLLWNEYDRKDDNWALLS